MNLTVRLFAGLADLLGGPVLILDTAGDPITAGELKQLIAERYPAAAAVVASSFVAKNRAYADPGDTLDPRDEIALIPPVSGGQPNETETAPPSDLTVRFGLTFEPLSVERTASLVGHPDHGATLVFVGTTREITHSQRTVRLEYEAYEPMALSTLEQIGDEIGERWPGALCAIVHRLGVVEVGEASVVIAVSTPHRPAVYEASRYAIERLKQIVPIWKKEIWEDGSEWKGHQLGPWDPMTSLT